MKVIKVRELEIGTGMTKIIVPIVETTKEKIINQGKVLSETSIDVVEWRVDFYEDVYDIEKVLETLKELRTTLGEKVILFTFRTKKEGGEKEIEMPYYLELNTEVAKSGLADMQDVEIFSGDEIVREIIDNIHQESGIVIASNHDFFKTPEKEEIINRLRKMQDMGADIPKIALMPNTTEDVNILLDATREMNEKYANRPIITMSMGGKGVVSRLSGELFGSSMTFGALGKVSAPGQVQVDDLKQILEVLHNSL